MPNLQSHIPEKYSKKLFTFRRVAALYGKQQNICFMKKFLKFAIAAIAAVTITTVLVSAAVAGNENETENIEFSSKSCPALDCSMSVSQAKTIFGLLPAQIKKQCSNEYFKLSVKCRETYSYVYQGVRITTSQKRDGIVSICLTYGDYTIKVNNTTWFKLEELFGQI